MSSAKNPPLSTACLDEQLRISDYDLYLIQEGNHQELYRILGSHPVYEKSHIIGYVFRLWAPNAHNVCVIGDFNHWHYGVDRLEQVKHSGIWQGFCSSAKTGDKYKFAFIDYQGNYRVKADPFARYTELRPQTASILTPYDEQPTPSLEQIYHNQKNRPISIYEVHLGSWRRNVENNYWLSYEQLAKQLIEYVVYMGFTHIELLPITEFPFDGSWGYQPTSLYSPSSRFGDPYGLKYLIDYAHKYGINVILDWSIAHFPTDEHGLAFFDGTHLYEHSDPKEGFHHDWNSLIYNYGRNEVRNYLVANALYWLKQYNFDGIRVDAVASMLYRDYSRKAGEWIPNCYGGRENLEAIEFLKQVNGVIKAHRNGALSIAEESTSFPAVTHHDGLNFDFKWNMGWMNDTLAFMREDPLYRRYHHHKMTFAMMYQYSENFILPLSHDEMVHGKGSLLNKMPGDLWQKFANLRAYYGYMWGFPGKKLLFMGGEFAQIREWNFEESLDWFLLDGANEGRHLGMQHLVRDLNHLYRQSPALFERDNETLGFEWLVVDDIDNSVFAFKRSAANGESIIVISNFTPRVLHNYCIGIDAMGDYLEVLNTDSRIYGGSNIGNLGMVSSQNVAHKGKEHSLSLTLGPLSTIFLKRVS